MAMRALLGLAAMVCSLASVAARAEVVDSTDTSLIIKLEAEAPADKTATWKMLLAPAQWWSPDHTWSGDAANLYIDAQATGCFCEKLPRPKDAPEGQRMGSVEHMHVVYADPQAGLLRMTGALGPLQVEPVRGTMTFTLKPAGEGTRIELTYLVGGFMKMKGGDMAPLVDKVLSAQLGRLVQRLAPVPAEAAPEKKD